MLDFFTDSPIPPTSMGKSAPRTMELDEAERYHETYSSESTIYDVIWEISDGKSPIGDKAMKVRLLLLIIVPISLLTSSVQPATSPAPKAEPRLPFAQELQDVLDDGLQATQGTGVSAAVIIPGQGNWVGAGGMSNRTASENIRPDMLFDVASVGKNHVAALVLQLAEEGRLTLEDPLHQWLPDYPNIDNTITIRQLLNHTSGLAHYTEHKAFWRTVLGELQRQWTPDDILALVPKPHYPPGQGWHYSSANYILLGMIVEEATDSTLATLLRDRVFTPLSLKHTFVAVDTAEAMAGAFAHAHYDLNKDGNLDDMNALPRTSIFTSAWAAGPIVSTAEDVARWADALYGGQVLSRASLAQMLTFHSPTPGEPCSGYGLGTAEFPREFFDGNEAWGHLGWQPGYMAAMLHFPEHSVSMAVLINDNNEECITSIAVGLWRVIKTHR